MSKLSDVKEGQIRQMGVIQEIGSRLCFVLNVEGFRADVVFSDGERDGVFTVWLSKNSIVVSEI